MIAEPVKVPFSSAAYDKRNADALCLIDILQYNSGLDSSRKVGGVE